MQDKKDRGTRSAVRNIPETRPIVVRVSWDSAELGDDPWLVGEWSDWQERTPIVRDVGDGAELGDCFDMSDPTRNGATAASRTTIRTGRAVLELGTGVYAYKVRSHLGYALNRAEPRTMTTGAHTNSVLAIEAAPEPILHAPCIPYVHLPPEGGVVLTARVRQGRATSLDVVWREGLPIVERRSVMTKIGEDATHLHFRVHLPASARVIQYVFCASRGAIVGREGGEPFVVSTSCDSTPSWWTDAVVYTVFVDRFRSEVDRADWDADPGRGIAAGGDLHGVRRSIPHLADLGINTLYLTPIHIGRSCHRYDVEDPSSVDPLLGGEDALSRLLDELHARGMRLLLDWSFSHAGTGFLPYVDVLAHGRASRFAGWFQVKEANRFAGEALEIAHYGGCSAAPLFDLHDPELAELSLRTAEAWIRRGVDGLRIDCAAQVPVDLLVELRTRVRALNPDAIVIGELVPEHAWRWRAAGALDASTDFASYRLARDRFATPQGSAVSLGERWREIERERGVESPMHALRFLSTHDFPRFFTLTKAAKLEENDALALIWLLTMPGVPMVLYGEELGMRSDVVEIDPEDVWRDRAPFPWGAERSPRALQIAALLRELLRLRRGVRALVHGNVESMLTEGPVWTYRRRIDGEIVDIVIYQEDEDVLVELTDDEFPGMTLLFRQGRATVDQQTVSFVGAGAVILRREARAPVVAPLALAARRDDLLRIGDETAVLPRRWDVALTEACNLRCAHCITWAPERTAHRQARAMTPFVLSHLREALAFVEHLGFVHGGESLLSPILFDFLAALREARRGAPTMVHLLTNGMLLSEDMTTRLVDAGVRSISVSLDGASPRTNDAVRRGGSFVQIVSQLERVARIRNELGCDLRLGISAVVLPNQKGDLVPLVELAARLELDWIKLEELVPATPFAKTSLLRMNGDVIRDTIEAACQRGAELGLVVVDHTTSMPRWICDLEASPRGRQRHEADEFANRATLHPCRDAWDLACIEPNGDVRVGSFEAAVTGNVTEGPFSAVWNGPIARAERARSRIARKCHGGEVVCLKASGGSGA